MNTQETKYQQAKERVEDIKGFYTHLVVYVLVNALLFTIDMLTSPDSIWFIWPLMGWGIAIVLHAARVFFGTMGSNWEEKKITKIMNEK